MDIKKIVLGCFAFITISCLGSCGNHTKQQDIKSRFALGAIKFVVIP